MSLFLLLVACRSGGLGSNKAEAPGETSEPVDSTPLPDDSDSPPDDSDTPPPVDSDEPRTDLGEAPEFPDIMVDCAGGADFSTIQAAIDNSRSGMRIGLRACTYVENINFRGKAVDVYGMGGSAVTVIEGTGSGPVVTAVRGEGVGTRLAGVTISGGRSNLTGGGLYVDAAVLRLDDVRFTENGRSASVAYVTGSSLELVDVRFDQNEVESGGAVILADNGSMLLQRVDLSCDGASYAIYQHVSMIVLDSDIRCEGGSGVVVNRGELHLRRSRVEADGYAVYGEDKPDTPNERMWFFNSAVVGGSVGAYSLYQMVRADNAVFYGGSVGLEIQYGHLESFVYDTAALGGTCGIRTDGSTYTSGWNAVQGTGAACLSADMATITADPQFVDAPADLHLAPGSPLIDAGDPDPSNNDDDDTPNDIGIYGGPEGDGPR